MILFFPSPLSYCVISKRGSICDSPPPLHTHPPHPREEPPPPKKTVNITPPQCTGDWWWLAWYGLAAHANAIVYPTVCVSWCKLNPLYFGSFGVCSAWSICALVRNLLCEIICFCSLCKMSLGRSIWPEVFTFCSSGLLKMNEYNIYYYKYIVFVPPLLLYNEW